MQAVIGQNKQILNETRDIYLNNTIMYSDSDHEKIHSIKNEFRDFLKVDDRD